MVTLKEWTAALRSGEYTQTQSFLRHDFRDENGEVIDIGYCCLGVLCDLDKDGHWDENWNFVHDEPILTGYFDNEGVALGVLEYHGIKPNIPQDLLERYAKQFNKSVEDVMLEELLASLNDADNAYSYSRALTFSELADLIEFGTLPEDLVIKY